jgi:thiazole synthase
MLHLYDKEFSSRLLLGTSRYPSPEEMKTAIIESQTQIVTVSLRRQSPESLGGEFFWNIIKGLGVTILPNTAGCFSVKEAVSVAHMAREFFNTNWIKLEVIGDEYTLQPNPFLLVEAAQKLVSDGFCVFPYMTEDLIVAKELVRIGCRVLMPWAAPIGTGKGITNLSGLKLLRKQFPDIPLIIDAGIGAPSHAALAMESGMDAVLLNTAVACAHRPVQMAKAFSLGIHAGREAYLAGLMPQTDMAVASTPQVGVPFK